MKIERANRPEQWDEYVERAAPQSLYYRWAWRDVVEDTFEHDPHYLIATDEERVCGVLPLVSIRSRLFGNSLVSIPFFSYGGVVADSEQARESLLSSAVELAHELGAKHVELRQGDESPMSWKSASSKVTMEIHLPPHADAAWKGLSSGMRNKVRNAQKHGLRAEWGGVELVDVFYKIWADNMHHLGTPVYPRRFFENQMKQFPGRIRILSLWDGTKPVAASFLTSHRDTLELPWSASSLESRKKYSQILMYWEFIQKAISEGFHKIDLGRCTKGSGTYEFKRHWNPVERPLHWYYWLAPGAALPKLNADNTKFKFAVEIWKRLPISLANGLGPRVVRSIP